LTVLFAISPTVDITACKWDTVIPFEPLWEQYKRIIKPNGAIVLFGSQPFTSALVMSNPKWFKYSWVWDKKCSTGFLNAKKQPLRRTEDICVFYQKSGTYNPHMVVRGAVRNKRGYNTLGGSDNYGKFGNVVVRNNVYYPTNILVFHNAAQKGKKHPTQKPTLLLEYLIKTYSIEGELILDNTAGSGSLAIAAMNTKRNYICIEKDDHYFQVMSDRIANHNPIAPPPKKSKPRPVPEGQLSLF